ALPIFIDIHREFDRPSKENTNDIRIIQLVADRLNLTVEEARLELRNGLMMIFPNLKKHFFPIPGSKEFLEWANGKLPLTLATNPVWPPDIVEMRVRWAGIDPSIFGFITHARLMHAVKPHAEYYLELLEKRGIKAEDCLLVGDDVRKDLPATQVGIRVFIVAGNGKSTLSPIKLPPRRAAAWRGDYSDLRQMLEAQLSITTSR